MEESNVNLNEIIVGNKINELTLLKSHLCAEFSFVLPQYFYQIHQHLEGGGREGGGREGRERGGGGREGD